MRTPMLQRNGVRAAEKPTEPCGAIAHRTHAAGTEILHVEGAEFAPSARRHSTRQGSLGLAARRLALRRRGRPRSERPLRDLRFLDGLAGRRRGSRVAGLANPDATEGPCRKGNKRTKDATRKPHKTDDLFFFCLFERPWPSAEQPRNTRDARHVKRLFFYERLWPSQPWLYRPHQPSQKQSGALGAACA